MSSFLIFLFILSLDLSHQYFNFVSHLNEPTFGIVDSALYILFS